MSKTVIYALTLPDDLDPAQARIFAGPVTEPIGLKLSEAPADVLFDLSADTGIALLSLIARETTIASVWVTSPDSDSDEGPIEIRDRAPASGPRWAILRRGDCLSRSGSWDYEPQPSSRSPEWLADHRFESVSAALEACERAGISSLEKERLDKWRAPLP